MGWGRTSPRTCRSWHLLDLDSDSPDAGLAGVWVAAECGAEDVFAVVVLEYASVHEPIQSRLNHRERVRGVCSSCARVSNVGDDVCLLEPREAASSVCGGLPDSCGSFGFVGPVESVVC